MTFDIQTLLSILAILLLWVILDKALSRFIKIKEDEDVKKAKELLERNGYSSHLYLPSIGVRDMELAQAMERVAHQGYVTLDRDGRMVGKVLPNLKKEKNTSLRLVVDNTKE